MKSFSKKAYQARVKMLILWWDSSNPDTLLELLRPTYVLVELVSLQAALGRVERSQDMAR